jgi:type I pantothenate kinase
VAVTRTIEPADSPDGPFVASVRPVLDALEPLVRGRMASRSARDGPFVLGITGGVGAGKSTMARRLARLLAAADCRPQVEVVCTDGFLLPNAELEARGLLERKGFPDSYDHRSLVGFLTALGSGQSGLAVPRYSHLRYDVVDEVQIVDPCDVVVLEGLHLLAPPPGPVGPGPEPSVRDFVHYALYLDAEADALRQWSIERATDLAAATTGPLRHDAHPYLRLEPSALRQLVAGAWRRINEPNLREHIVPTRALADAVVVFDRGHRVTEVSFSAPETE